MPEITVRAPKARSYGPAEPAGASPDAPDPGPTDPHSLGIDVEDIVVHANGDWKPAHRKLLTTLRQKYQDLVNRTLAPVGKEIGQPLNGWQFKCTKGPGQVTLAAEEELRTLKLLSSQLRKGRAELPSPSDVDHPTRFQWLTLIFVLIACIVGEAVANSFLLFQALDTGLAGAFITAVLVSAINVGAIGTGGGLTMSAIRRHSDSLVLVLVGCGFLLAAGVGLNLIVGRHREAFARVIEQRERQTLEATGIDFTSVREIVAGISFNPVTWELESLLFLVLGLALCAVGFYKGFTFIKAGTGRADAERLLDLEWKQIKDSYQTLSERYRSKLTEEVRSEVAGWIEKLDRVRRQARNVLEDVRESWDQEAYLHLVESELVLAHNKHNPEKIDRETLGEHRGHTGIDLSFPATPADWSLLEDANAVVVAWQDSGQKEFFDGIEQECLKIADLCERYQSVILGSTVRKEESGTK